MGSGNKQQCVWVVQQEVRQGPPPLWGGREGYQSASSAARLTLFMWGMSLWQRHYVNIAIWTKYGSWCRPRIR